MVRSDVLKGTKGPCRDRCCAGKIEHSVTGVGRAGGARGGVRMHTAMHGEVVGAPWAGGIGRQGGRRPRRVPEPTGRRVARTGQEWLVHTRHVLADPAAVWAAFTRPEHLERWIGTWRRLPDESVAFLFSFEGDDLLPAVYRLDACVADRSFSLSSPEPETTDPAHVSVEVTPAGVGATAGTVITLGHSVGNRALAPHLAVGCEYYLDRLVGLLEHRSAEAPGGPDGAEFDEYFVAQAAHYRRLFPAQRGPRR